MLDFIKRNTPKICENFILKSIEIQDNADCYEIYAENGKIVLAASNKLSHAMAFYRYLNEYCNIIITSGDYDISGIAKTPLPSEKISYCAPQKIRARISYDMFALSGNYWGFDRWEKEIDFMAMHGINAPLQAVGFDGVLYKLLTDIGMSEEFCLEFTSGPAFLMRQFTGNIAGTNSINSLPYLERKITIGKMITDREKSMGMSPVFPAILPSVPFSLRKKYIKMDIFKAPLWYNFPPIFLIKPDNAFFQVFNKKFLEMQCKLLGETDFYICEPLYDVDHKGYNSYSKAFGKAISQLLCEYNNNAMCFTHAASLTKDFFDEADSDKFIVIGESDFTSDKKTLVEISGNKYGRTAVYGDIDKVCRCPYCELKEKNPNVIGTSLAIDSFEMNAMYCAAALNAIKTESSFNADDFVRDFSKKRYSVPDYDSAMLTLKNLCYSSDENEGSIICTRPATELKHTAPYDTIIKKTDFHKLYELVSDIVSSDTRKNDNLRADLSPVVCSMLSSLAYPIYLKSTEFFRNKDAGNFEQASNLFLEICQDADRLMSTRKSTNLFTKIEEARQLGDSKEEKQDLEINFLFQHTIWGPFDHSIVYDTCWAEYGGLIKDYYAQRWFMYFHSLAAYFDNPKKLKDMSKKQPLDRNEYKGSYQAKRLAIFENNFLENYIPKKDEIEKENTIDVIQEILEKYSEIVKQF